MWTLATVTVALVFLCCAVAGTYICEKCYCYAGLGIIDCTRIELHTIPQLQRTLHNCTSLLLRHNYIKHCNFSALISLLPQLEIIDLQVNDALLCENLLQSSPPSSLKIVSYCGLLTTVKPLPWNRLPAWQNHLLRIHYFPDQGIVL